MNKWGQSEHGPNSWELPAVAPLLQSFWSRSVLSMILAKIHAQNAHRQNYDADRFSRVANDWFREYMNTQNKEALEMIDKKCVPF